MDNKKYDLEDRLVKFACMYLDVCDLFGRKKTGRKLRIPAIEKFNIISTGLWIITGS